MARIFVTNRRGSEQCLNLTEGHSVMEALRENGVDEILALCGGSCSCATCHVHVDSAFIDSFPAPTDDENDLLDSSGHRAPNSRLACQLRLEAVHDGLRLTIAPED